MASNPDVYKNPAYQLLLLKDELEVLKRKVDELLVSRNGLHSIRVVNDGVNLTDVNGVFIRLEENGVTFRDWQNQYNEVLLEWQDPH
jgi:hypothetical protein